jgi:hypothetical protein
MNELAELARLRASLEESARFGSPVDLSVANPRNENEKVEIEQLGGPFESQILELPTGCVAYMADIAVTNQTSRTIDLIEVELRTPWDDNFFQWLQPEPFKFQLHGKRSRSHSVYHFAETELRFTSEQVINHYLVELRKLPGNRRLEGLLLAIGGRMPAGLRHGQELDMPLTIIGSDHAEYSTTIHLWTDRLLARPTTVKIRKGIFAEGVAELVAEETASALDVTRTAPLPASPPPASNRT